MPNLLDPESRFKLLQDLEVGQPITPERVGQELDQGWLLPSRDGTKELQPAEWAL